MKYLKLHPFQNLSNPLDIKTNLRIDKNFIEDFLQSYISFDNLVQSYKFSSSAIEQLQRQMHFSENSITLYSRSLFNSYSHTLKEEPETLFEDNHLFSFESLDLQEDEIAFTDNIPTSLSMDDNKNIVSFIPLFVFKKDQFLTSVKSYKNSPIFTSLYKDAPLYFDHFLELKSNFYNSLNCFLSPSYYSVPNPTLADINFSSFLSRTYRIYRPSCFYNNYRRIKIPNSSPYDLSLNYLSKTHMATSETYFENAQEYFSSQRKVLKSNNITSSSKQTEFKLVDIKPKSLKSSLGILFPTLRQTFFLDSSSQDLKKAYFFSFTMNYADKMGTNFSSSSLTTSLLSNIVSDRALSIFDFSLYQEKLKETYSNLDIKNTVLLETLSKYNLQDEFVATIKTLVPQDSLSIDQLKITTSKINVDFSRLDKISSKLSTYSQSIFKSFSHKKNIAIRLSRRYHNSFSNSSIYAKFYFDVINDYTSLNFSLNKIPLLLKRQKLESEKVKQDFKTAYEKKSFTYDTFFENYKLYNIISLTYHIQGEPTPTTFTPSENLESFNEFFFSEKFLNEKVSITEIYLETTQPSKIIVDSKPSPNKDRIAGPYCIKVKQDSNSSNLDMRIKLSSKNSYFGVMSSDTFKAHPHSRPIGFKSLYTHYQSCCLGEATPLISKAMSQGSLKTILMGISVWLNSANSSDYWGKSYFNFPHYSHYLNQIESLDQKELSYDSDDVEESISSFSDLNQTSQTQPVPEIQVSEPPENQELPQPIEVNTDQATLLTTLPTHTYVRYHNTETV